MRLSFHGADRSVTGSCHLIECDGRRILIDCGLFQGGRELDEENEQPFGFDPASIDFVLLTHAHLDHCGRLPLLIKRGFRGEIITTSASRELARLVLLDTARLQHDEAVSRSGRADRHPVRRPLYTQTDVQDALRQFGRTSTYDEPLDLTRGVRATSFDAGHILGSASILLELTEGTRHRRVLFSGDLGNVGRPLLRDPTPASKSDVVVMETTYGDRLHKPFDASVKELYDAINQSLVSGGNVIIPTFALERAQELLYCLRSGVDRNLMTPAVQIFLDSPMAISATEIFRRHPECYDEAAAEFFEEGRDPFNLPGLHFTQGTSDSIALNTITGGAVIMAGSGMCTGGRVRHHLRHNLWRNNASIIFVGFAAKGVSIRRRPRMC